MNDVSPELVKATLRMRQNAEDRSTRSFPYYGVVGPDSTIVFFPEDEIREPIVVARSQVEEVEKKPAVACAWCEKQMSDEVADRWTSHSICDDCLDEHFPEDEENR